MRYIKSKIIITIACITCVVLIVFIPHVIQTDDNVLVLNHPLRSKTTSFYNAMKKVSWRRGFVPKKTPNSVYSPDNIFKTQQYQHKNLSQEAAYNKIPKSSGYFDASVVASNISKTYDVVPQRLGIRKEDLNPGSNKLTNTTYTKYIKKIHSDDNIKEILKKSNPNMRYQNMCLYLKPKVYIKNTARTFTDEELDIDRYKNSKPLIPKIIHQTWNTYDVPQASVPYIKSILKYHPAPEWQYWFWTQKDIECYFKKHHPEYLDLYHDYNAPIFKTDVMRYFILYDFGGFYLDLDVEALKPLDIWTHIGGCILSHETYEHTFFEHMRSLPNVMTTVLATEPKHPYYKLLQENLAKYHRVCANNVLYSTGPFYIDNIYQLYVQAYAKSTDTNITIIHPRYWLPTYTGGTSTKVRRACIGPVSKRRSVTKQQRDYKLCETAIERKYHNGPWPDSYLNHYWMNSNVKGSKFLLPNTVNLFSFAPHLRKVSDMLQLYC